MIQNLDNFAIYTGKTFRQFLEHTGSIFLFFCRILKAFPFAINRFYLVIEQMMFVGYNSIPIVLLTSTFVGAVSAWQVQYLFANAIPLTYLGAAVGKAVLTELGPVLTALVITGRIGAKLAAELGTMRVTDQVDAMICLSLDPFDYLLAPRLIAGIIMVPVLTIFSTFFAIVSAQLLSEFALGLSQAAFYQGLKQFFKFQDVVICIVKAFFFGAVITLSGCYYGFTASGGAVGVGKSTKQAVVTAMVLVLITNLILVSVLL